MTKAFQRLVFLPLPLLVFVGLSVICRLIVRSLATALRVGGQQNYSPLLAAVQTSKALGTLTRQVSAAHKAARQTKGSFPLTEVSPDAGRL